MRRLGRLGTALLFAASSLGFGAATASAEDYAGDASQAAPWGAEASTPVALLGRLHHSAQREVQLGQLAAASAASPATRRYGARLAADFDAFDSRIVTLASGLGIGTSQLAAPQAGENVIALRKEADDLGRLANEQGKAFDREFWVTVAESQSADADMLAATVTREPALLGLVSDMSRLYSSSSKRALAAAAGTASTPQPR